jgi:hypothetical protein
LENFPESFSGVFREGFSGPPPTQFSKIS